MRLKNSADRYGLFSVGMHWLVAVLVFILFGVGVWMVDLSYYHPWYHPAPFWHKSFGVLLLLLMLMRVLWRLFTPQPQAIATHSPLIRFASKAGHLLIYVLLFAIMVAGYLISTADGAAVDVFGLFKLPAVVSNLPEQADRAGLVHKYLAWGLMFVVAGHALAAIKHHLIDKDATLLRMLGKAKDS